MKPNLATTDRDAEAIREMVARHTDQEILSIEFDYAATPFPVAQVYVGTKLTPMIGCGERFTLTRDTGIWAITGHENWMCDKAIL
jgi:hypothetical protein